MGEQLHGADLPSVFKPRRTPVTVLGRWRTSSRCVCGRPWRRGALGGGRGDSGKAEKGRQHVWNYAGGMESDFCGKSGRTAEVVVTNRGAGSC